jgi:hypothetical protein
MAVGRISGPLLKANLIRDGVNLAFETDLLYLDVNNNRIGVNKVAPSTDLDVNGTTRSTDLLVHNQIDVGDLHITGNTISSDSNINFQPSGGDPTVYHSRLQIDDFELQGNVISTTVSSSNIEVRPNGSGTIELINDTYVTGDLFVSGNVNSGGNVVIGGDIVIGDSLTDSIEINASIQSDLIPETDDTYDIGSSTHRWRSVYADNVYADTLNLPTLDIGDLIFRNNEITTTSGNDVYIDGNGTGGVRLGNFRFADNSITNVVNNAVTEIAQTGTGYFKIQGTNGFVPPVGTTAERPSGYAVLGMTRYNTNSKSLEIWDGLTWASPAGASGAVSETDANEISAIFSLMLG